MSLNVLKKMVTKIFSTLSSENKLRLMNYLQRQLTVREKTFLGLQNLSNALVGAKKIGFNPSYIIDVGAHNGNWTNEVKDIFPEAPFIIIEALPAKTKLLEEMFSESRFDVYGFLLGNEEKKQIPFYSMETGSSVMEELTNVPREMIYLDMTTLDRIAAGHEELGQSILLKLDVQGFELEVLKGAEKVLDSTELICMEVSLLNYNRGAPLMPEVISAMNQYDFLPFDFVGFHRKSNDCALMQTDMFFIKKSSPLRQKVNRFDQNFQVIASN